MSRGMQEYHQNNNAIVIEETEIGQTVSIFGCKSSIVQIKGKVNAVNLGEERASVLSCVLGACLRILSL
jgi:Adenylate cyclase associated (CAP) C terminal